jgi:formylmethanofuran dehydrogenase subunit D
MTTARFVLISVRSTKQGQRINSGKEHADYQSIVTTLTMNADDMKALSVETGAKVFVRSEHGEAVFECKDGKVPQGMVTVPYGPPTCRLFVGDTDGTGMPTTKGWEVEIGPVGQEAASPSGAA